MFSWLGTTDPNRLNAYAAIAAATVAVAALVIPALWHFVSRPHLAVDYENRRRWRRRSPIAETSVVALFIRVRVTNNGWRSAKAVTGVLSELLESDGSPVLDIDPFILH